MPTIVPNASKKIDEAFDKFTGFQQKYCIHLRALVHHALPDVKEDWKWGPNFNVNGMVCGIWGFKNHVKLVFFKGTMMRDKYKLFNDIPDNRGSRSINFSEEDKIDDKKIIEYLKEAAELNKKGAKLPKPVIVVEIPEELEAILKKSKKVKEFFDCLAPSHQREYAQYISEAKREDTRKRRVEKVMDMLIAKKKMNEEYMK